MEDACPQATAKIRFKPSEVSIESSSPFCHDKLGRKAEIENLTNLLIHSEAPLVLAIDAEWGSGKTTFMKMWKSHLTKEHPSHASIYFSAWETDLSDDPLLVFLGEVNEQLASKTTGMTRFKWEKAKSLAGQITKRSLPALVKMATYGVLDINNSGIESTIAELSGGIASDSLEAYKASVTAIQQFKENLSGFLADRGSGSPVIVFIDELDRCRPHYAIALLERIKHLLNLPGLLFVLGIDRRQLANAIRGAYGELFDSETYLQRFIDLDYQLPICDVKSFTEKLVVDYGLNTFFEARNTNTRTHINNESGGLVDVCTDVASLFRLQLREIEQLLARVNIVARSTDASEPIYPYLLVGLLALRVKVPSLYSSLTSSKGSTIEFLRLITEKWEEKPLDKVDNIGILVACVVLAVSEGDAADPGIAYVSARSIATEGISSAEKELMSSAALLISQLGAQPSMRIYLHGLVKRIEMAQSFRV